MSYLSKYKCMHYLHALPTAYQLTVDQVAFGASESVHRMAHCWILCRWQHVVTPLVEYDELYIILIWLSVPFSLLPFRST